MRCAIVDIGYNAIRAVVYENHTLGSQQVFSKKFKSDIRTLLVQDAIDSKHHIYLSINYLSDIFKKLSVKNIKCVATAVLRNHENAQKFIDYVQKQFNLSIEVISGEEESRFAASGLMSGIRNCHGVMADLGGGSLELVTINHQSILQSKSFELGTKVIDDALPRKHESEITNIIHEKYAIAQYDNLYLVGGALRYMGSLYMQWSKYPIATLHNLEIQSQKFIDFLDVLQSMDNNQISLKCTRADQNAIIICKGIVNAFRPKNIIMSVYGLKEGVKLSLLSEEELKKDMIEEKIKQFCNITTSNIDFNSYYNLITPLVSYEENIKNLIKYSIMFLILRNRLEKTLDSNSITELILSLDVPLTHQERVMIAISVSYYFNRAPSQKLIAISRQLVSKQNYYDSKVVGLILHLTELVDGPDFTSPSFDIYIHQGMYLELQNSIMLPHIVFEKARVILKYIAAINRQNKKTELIV